MATKNHYVTNFADGEVADDTEIRYRLFSDEFTNDRADDWDDFNADKPTWRVENPGQPDPRNCVVATRAAPTKAERTFVQVRFKVQNDTDSEVLKKSTDWVQVNANNYTDLPAAFGSGHKNIFDTERALKSLVPTT